MRKEKEISRLNRPVYRRGAVRIIKEGAGTTNKQTTLAQHGHGWNARLPPELPLGTFHIIGNIPPEINSDKLFRRGYNITELHSLGY